MIKKAILNRQIWCDSNPKYSDYANGFIRTKGSYVKEVTDFASLFTFVDAIKNIKPIDGDMPDFLYFEAEIPAPYTGFEGINLISELTDEELATIRVVKGEHGIEHVSDAIKPTPTKTAIFILDEDGLVTWFPGRLTPCIDKDNITVKLDG